jgi:hypothetical protein
MSSIGLESQMSRYAVERVDDGWRAVSVDEEGKRQPIGPMFPTQTEAVLYTFDVDASCNSPEACPQTPLCLTRARAAGPTGLRGTSKRTGSSVPTTGEES